MNPDNDKREIAFGGELHLLRRPCSRCGADEGLITTVNGQDTVRCAQCKTFLYNAPRVETGREQRSVSTRPEIKPKQRARILDRDNAACVVCGSTVGLHIGHILSVEEGRAQGADDLELFDDENLAVMCAECNLGWGVNSLSPRLALRLIRARMARRATA